MSAAQKRVFVVTPTADRPLAFNQCFLWLERQTFLEKSDVTWLVMDGGQEPVVRHKQAVMGGSRDGSKVLTMQHLRTRPLAEGFQNLANNVALGLEQIADFFSPHADDLIVFFEDDDWYAPWHLEDIVRRLESSEVAGSVWQPYYNLRERRFRVFKNRVASLCQTGLWVKHAPLLREAIAQALAEKSYGIDGRFWKRVMSGGIPHDLYETVPTIGIKGLPGKTGLGVGHRPDKTWKPDPEFAVLRQWIGDEDAQTYIDLISKE